MEKIILIIHVIVAIALVGLILIQHSKSEAGAAFGGGSSQTLLGSAGSGSILGKITAGLVAIFFITSLSLAYVNRHFGEQEAIIIDAEETIMDPVNKPQDSDIPQITVNPVESTSSDIPVVESQAQEVSKPGEDSSVDESTK